MTTLKQHLLNHVPVTDEEWDVIQNSLTHRKLKRKELFLKEGTICREIGLIMKGYVRLYYLKDGLDITKDFNFENGFCGSWASFSAEQPSLFNIVAMEDAEMYTFTRQQLFSWFTMFPQLEKMGRLNMEKMFIKKELREASFLLDSAEERYRKLLEEYPDITQRVPLKYIASYLGISPETVSRIRARKPEQQA